MKMNAIDIRVGNILDHNAKLWQVYKTQVTKPGKGGAFITVEMKDIQGGSKDIVRFRTEDTVEKARVDQVDHQYLYADGDDYYFMNQTSYEQIMLTSEQIGDGAVYLQDEMIVGINMYEGQALSVDLPDTVTLEIVEAEPVVKGQTASSSYKPAILENGVKVMVPPHISSGTRVVVRTEDSTYVEKAKD
ncbi:MAG: elongation factor P [Rickettsiales bacterium]|nr:elongation factor P [Rickettsiales bacterium]